MHHKREQFNNCEWNESVGEYRMKRRKPSTRTDWQVYRALLDLEDKLRQAWGARRSKDARKYPEFREASAEALGLAVESYRQEELGCDPEQPKGNELDMTKMFSGWAWVHTTLQRFGTKYDVNRPQQEMEM